MNNCEGLYCLLKSYHQMYHNLNDIYQLFIIFYIIFRGVMWELGVFAVVLIGFQ